MTREEQRQEKANKLLAKKQAKDQLRQERHEEQAWNRMVATAKAKGAWIEEETNLVTQTKLF